MGTYGQWARARPARRLTLVCGPEPVLARDVVQAHRQAVSGPQASLFAGSMPESELWDRVLSDPPPGGRLTVVWGAEKLDGRENIGVLARAGGMDTAFTVFVFGTGDFERQAGDGRQPAAPYVLAVQKCRLGQLVRCCAPSSAAEQTRLVQGWWRGATENLAYDVLARCGGDLGRAWQACDKATRAGLEPNAVMAALVCDDPQGGFADFLVAGDKKSAMAAATRISSGETGPVLGLLAARLSALAEIGASRRRGTDEPGGHREDRFLHRMLARHAGEYPSSRVSRDREVLAMAESAWKRGARTGVLESVVALW